MYFGPKTKSNADSIENEELQIVEAMYQAEEFPDSLLENEDLFFEAED
ncbi:MAG TPA: hypothetical protein PKO28_03560 [Bacilli bacterium]|nr:hypothetical protein [Bacilli bacterium]HPS19201.1 hypothetical protein [Bacilli bacterium]